ncbi:MAG: SPASM domain-containing protein [Ktedonobacteraceae bacterium]|nr:SPASM domain-containing protein [Chloroflexota bacterium]
MQVPIVLTPRKGKDSCEAESTENTGQYPLRASSYTIFVDLPDNSEEMLLVHGYTGAYDLVSQKVATYIRSLESRNPPRPLYGVWTPAPLVDGEVARPSEPTIDLLKRRGYLTEKTLEEEEAFFVKIANAYHAKMLRATPSYVLMPTYDCNLRCAYCFQDHMRTDPTYSHLLHAMSKPIIDRIVNGMLDIETKHDLPPADDYVRNIGFFGGEPFLARNRRVIDYIIDKVHSIGKASFWGVSNFTDLDAYEDLLGPDCIKMLQVTVDGPALEHNKRRIYADGSGSFDRIARNVSMALERGVQINMRMNIDRINIEFLPELAEEIIARGWNKYPHFSAYTAPIHAANKNVSVKTTFDSWSLDKALNQKRLEYPAMHVIHRPDDPLKDTAQRLIEQQGQPFLHAQFCGAHASMYVIDPFASVYACWERTGDAKVRMGHITPQGKYEVEENLSKMWRSRNVTTNKICRQCRYALNCGGGCAVRGKGGSENIFTNHCDGYAARYRASVAEAYVAHRAGIKVANQIENLCDL